MKIQLALIACALLLSACASTELKPTGSFVYDASAQMTYDYVRGRTHKCWRKKGDLLSDGIYIVKGKVDGPDAIIVSNTYTTAVFDYDHRLQQNVIVEIVFHPVSDKRTRVEVREKQFVGGSTREVYRDVERWLGGDASCAD